MIKHAYTTIKKKKKHDGKHDQTTCFPHEFPQETIDHTLVNLKQPRSSRP